MVNYWFVVHSSESYKENPNLIGFAERKFNNERLPINSLINLIRPNDLIVYYCKGNRSIIGIFMIKGRVYNFEDKWKKNPIQFKIVPEFLPKKEFDFKELVYSKKLDMFKRLNDISRWGSKIQGTNVIRLLSKNDFDLIFKSLKHNYLRD